jgi:hypothetical protein
MIYLEPRKEYDGVILEEDYEHDVVVYSYEGLVDILMKQISTHYKRNDEELYSMAVELVDNDIEDIKARFKSFPVLRTKEEYRVHKKKKDGMGLSEIKYPRTR